MANLILKHVDAVSLEQFFNAYQVVVTVIHTLYHGYLLLALVTYQSLLLERKGMNIDEIQVKNLAYTLIVRTEELAVSRHYLKFGIKVPE